MVRKLGKRQENLLAKIAAQLGKDFEEIKEVAQPLYSQEARILQKQAIYNFFKARVRPEKQMVMVNGKKRLETDKEFEARYNEWKFKICEECKLEFAYAYSYDGVKFCSLECLDSALRRIGLQVTPNRDVRKRWGNHSPAIVPASVLEELRTSYSDSEGMHDVSAQIGLPKLHQESHTALEVLHGDIDQLQDSQHNNVQLHG